MHRACLTAVVSAPTVGAACWASVSLPEVTLGKINWGRVVVGGLLAGVVLNIVDYLTYGVWLKADMAAAMTGLGKSPAAMDSAIPLWVALDFVSGIGLLWVYAAIRPRFGAGGKTAVIAGLAGWVFGRPLHAIGGSPV